MKIFDKLPRAKLRGFRQLVFVLMVSAVVSHSSAQVITNNNSSLYINTASGASSWLVDGVNQMNLQWFYYRIGNGGPESPIHSISGSPTVLSPIPGKSLDVTYANSILSVDVTYSFLGSGSVGSANSTISETISVRNLTAGNLDLHFFQYTDLNLANTAANQTAAFSIDGTGHYIATQALGSKTATEKLTSGSTSVAHVQADSTGQILASLLDGGSTTLSDVNSTGPAGDATYAIQWDKTLAPSGQTGEALPISILVTVVPEPSIFGLVSVLTLLSAFAANTKRSAVKMAQKQ